MKEKVITFFIHINQFPFAKYAICQTEIRCSKSESYARSNVLLRIYERTQIRNSCRCHIRTFSRYILGTAPWISYTAIYRDQGYLNGSFERLFYDEDVKLPIVLMSAS